MPTAVPSGGEIEQLFTERDPGTLAKALEIYLRANLTPEKCVLDLIANCLSSDGPGDWKLVFQRRRAGNQAQPIDRVVSDLAISHAIESAINSQRESNSRKRVSLKLAYGLVGEKFRLKEAAVRQAYARAKGRK